MSRATWGCTVSCVESLKESKTRRETAEVLATKTATKQLLTRPEAAESLSLSVRMVDELVKSGDLPAVRIGRAIRFRPSALEYFIEAREGRKPVAKRKGVAK